MMPKLRIAVIGVGADRGSRARQYLGKQSHAWTDHYETRCHLRPQSQGASGGRNPIRGKGALRKRDCPF